jgi:hypothetical protein
MPRCAGSKPNGTPCERIVGASQDYCYSHDPERSEERHRAASKAGRSKPSKEIQDIKQRLSDLASDVIDGAIDRGDAAVAGQLLGTVVRAIATELKVKEQQEILERLEVLEQMQEEQKGGKSRWG